MKVATTKFYQTQEFKKLNDEWQSKIKKLGFEDIENPKNEYAPLEKTFDNRTTRTATAPETEQYYSLFQEYLINGTFDNERQKQICEYRSNGLTMAEISKELKCSKSAVAYQIWKIQKRIGLQKMELKRRVQKKK